MTRAVLVTVGVDGDRFASLVRTVDAWAGARPDVRLIVHHGRGTPARHAVRNLHTVTTEAMRTLIETTDVVVADASTAVVREAHRAGRMPIVLPRSRRRPWSRTHAQQAFAGHLMRQGHVMVARTPGDLRMLLNHALADPPVRSSTASDARRRATVRRMSTLLDQLQPPPLLHGADEATTPAPHP